MFEKLPFSVRQRIMQQFLYRDFLSVYLPYFKQIRLINRNHFKQMRTIRHAQTIKLGSVNLKAEIPKESEVYELMTEFQMFIFRLLEPWEIAKGE